MHAFNSIVTLWMSYAHNKARQLQRSLGNSLKRGREKLRFLA